jgi:hypothetical protein
VSVRAIGIANEERQRVEKSLISTSISVSEKTADGLWVTGDSVILGIRSKLSESRSISLINARIGRQAPELLSVILHDKASAVEAPIIFNLGNNNALTREQTTSIFEAIKDQPRAIVVNTAVPRPWREGNNSLIAEIAAQYPTVRIVDWNSISEGHPEYFAPDGVHLVPTGVDVFVYHILRALNS